ncbi:MAG: hypothetical protein FJ106_06690 [Deltaproteobacteria bacterium]|nr:hypothetical protein [Deltaproteobacteria bacterium]
MKPLPTGRQAFRLSVRVAKKENGVTVTMLVSKQDARKTKIEHQASIYETPCLSADRDTSLDNDKR